MESDTNGALSNRRLDRTELAHTHTHTPGHDQVERFSRRDG